MRRYYLYRRKQSKAWYVLFVDPETGKHEKRRSTETSDKRQAEAIAQEWLANGLPDDLSAIKTAKKTGFCDYLTDFWDFDTSEYFNELQTMGKEPHRAHALEMQKLVKRYFEDYFGNTLLCQIDEMKLQKFVVYLKISKKLSSATVNLARNAAFVALRYAKRNKILKHFDFDAVLRAGGSPKDRGILEREEVEKLFNLEWRDPRSRLVNRIASQTGMRMGEIRALRICDIHEDRISVKHSWSKVDGGLKCTKNRETREIPILPELYQELLAYIKELGGLFRKETHTGDPGEAPRLDSLLFPSLNDDSPYDNKQIERDYFVMLKKIGIDDKMRKKRNIVFHSWRHYCAKNLAQVTNRTIGMAILGQKTSSMFDHYANHVDKETFDKMTKAVEQGLKPGIGEKKEPIPFKKAAGDTVETFGI
jgi:integrase